MEPLPLSQWERGSCRESTYEWEKSCVRLCSSHMATLLKIVRFLEFAKIGPAFLPFGASKTSVTK